MRGSYRHGFTLFELSIVLVIIGLLVGGILVGRDLIKTAEMRSQVSQIEKFKTAVNTFRLKYDALPGDMLITEAQAFGFVAGTGNGNGLIRSTADQIDVCNGEIPIFWYHLQQANLIAEPFPDPAVAFDLGGQWVVTVNANITAPRAKLGRDNYIYVYGGFDGLNYFQIYPYTQVHSTGAISGFSSNGITPQEAYIVDFKMDDGMPNTGTVVSRGVNTSPSVAPTAAATSTSGNCNIGDGTAMTDTYNLIAATGGNDTSCSLQIRAGY